MNSASSERIVRLSLPESLAHALMASLSMGIMESLGVYPPEKPDVVIHSDTKSYPSLREAKYRVELLGETFSAKTLPDLFSWIIDKTARATPEVIDKLSKCKSRKRGFVSRNKNDIHPDRPDLSTMLTKTGWYISRNIGQEDLIRALKKLCGIANLRYDIDLRFLALPSGDA